MKEVSPLTVESKKSVGKSSPAKPPNPAYESLPAETKLENQEKTYSPKKLKSPQKPPQSPLKLKNKLTPSEGRFSL